MRKFLAYPAYLSTKMVARFCPEKAAETGWDGTFDLDCMYPSGYVFGAVVYSLMLAGLLFGLGLAL